jgi:osmotically-inducible protein OsmY
MKPIRNLSTFLAVLLAALVLTVSPVQATPALDGSLNSYLQHRLDERHLEGVQASVQDGIATLRGEVANLRQRDEAERLARGTEGVMEVDNQIALQPADTSQIRSDLQKVLNRYPFYDVFDWVEAVPNGSEVTLTGWVYQPWHKRSIALRVEAIPGVTAVHDQIKILPVSAFDDQLRAQAAQLIYGDLMFSSFAETPNPPIHILVHNGKITLEGVVHNAVERRLAESLVRSGTMSFGVVNGLRTEREIAM